MLIGYNTNGTADHRWTDALELMAEIGYRAVALTVDHDCLDPYSARLDEQLAQMQETLGRLRLTSVIETGARFLLNPREKHEPTLLSGTEKERAVRIDFLRRCIDIATALESTAVSFWSGRLRVPIPEAEAYERLAAGCRTLIAYAAEKNVPLAFEPEPGMFIETMDQYARLLEHVDGPQFGLTIDIGHLHCVETEPIPVHLRRWKDRLRNVHIEDMRRGVHEHLRFGQGEIDFREVIETLREIDYRGPVCVELSRHSHMAPVVMRESFEFLQGIMGGQTASTCRGR